jgi:hypothetical protein
MYAFLVMPSMIKENLNFALFHFEHQQRSSCLQSQKFVDFAFLKINI